MREWRKNTSSSAKAVLAITCQLDEQRQRQLQAGPHARLDPRGRCRWRCASERPKFSANSDTERSQEDGVGQLAPALGRGGPVQRLVVAALGLPLVDLLCVTRLPPMFSRAMSSGVLTVKKSTKVKRLTPMRIRHPVAETADRGISSIVRWWPVRRSSVRSPAGGASGSRARPTAPWRSGQQRDQPSGQPLHRFPLGLPATRSAGSMR